MDRLKKLLEPFEVIHNIVVEWGDMDAAQHVNNTIYLRWVESARVSYFQKMQMDITSTYNSEGEPLPAEEGIILGYVDCKYIFPVTFPDNISVGVKITEIKEDRMVMESQMFSEKHQRIVAVSKQEIVPYNYVKRQKIPVSQNIIQTIEAIEKKSFE